MRKKLAPAQLTVIALLVLGIFLRFYNFTNTLQFIGDQGRDAIVVLHMIRDHHPVLIGPVTSTGNMYLGPLYYYLMVPFLALSYPSPLGPAIAVAVLSVITIYAIYKLGKEIVGTWPAVIAAGVYTCSSMAVVFARFSWNPNPAPFFGIVLLWATQRFWKKSAWYLILCALCIAVLAQLHYVTLLTIPAVGVIWLAKIISVIRDKKHAEVKKLALASVISVILFLISFAPLVAFDMRHDFLNFHAFQSFLAENSGGFTHTDTLSKLIKTIKEVEGRGTRIVFEMFIGKYSPLNIPLLCVVITVLFFLTLQRKSRQYQTGYAILSVFILLSAIGLAFYQSPIFDHYLAFLVPTVALVYGVVLTTLWKSMFGKVGAIAFVLLFLVWNVTTMPLQSLSWTISDVERTAKTIADRVKPGEKYNLVLLTATGDIEGQNYRYFLETMQNRPLPKEQWGETETLFIINEDMRLKRVVDSPIYEIVVFPNKDPAEVYTIPNGPEITVLRKKEK